MFQAAKPLFIYCVSPVHMGAGTALGVIDNPIQRERHTEYPQLAGSGLKGAIRHHFQAQARDARLVTRLFGPDSDKASDHAGAVSFADAQLVAFPVRSARRGYVYATSALALARLRRLLELADHAELPWQVPAVPAAGAAKVADTGLAGALALEAYQLEATEDAGLKSVAAWLGTNALPDDAAHAFFRAKFAADLVLLPDEDFGWFTRNATLVEPHVRINDESGTADDGGLFYTENLPPESLLATVLMASVERHASKQGRPDGLLDADTVLATVLDGRGEALPGIRNRLLQVGGDATTGRGQVLFTALEG